MANVECLLQASFAEFALDPGRVGTNEDLGSNNKLKNQDACPLIFAASRLSLFKSRPEASDKTHARLIAALGDDRNRFDSADALQCAAGIAPLTEQSGKSRHVRRRWAATTFMMQTFFEYAGLSIKGCAWAKAFYQSQLAKGKSSSMAKRSLAFKWIRIIYHCWKTSTPYDEATHLNRLAQQGSPMVHKLTA
ncbi:MAG TPA: transposase [Pirellulaceae bacterium]|nr:transposase [Pirellulaceae bacterium]HMO93852.1 transposase [Pirellulaceae bacterium]